MVAPLLCVDVANAVTSHCVRHQTSNVSRVYTNDVELYIITHRRRRSTLSLYMAEVISRRNAWGRRSQLLTCSRAHYWTALRTIFRPKNALYIAGFCLGNLKKFCPEGRYPPPRTPAEVPPVLGPRHQFLLGSSAFRLFLFTVYI